MTTTCCSCDQEGDVLLAGNVLCSACARAAMGIALIELDRETAWRAEQARPEIVARRERASAQVAAEIAEGRSACVSLRAFSERVRARWASPAFA